MSNAAPLPRPSFEELQALLMPIILRGLPKTCSIGLAEEIAEDCAFMINRGKTHNMIAEISKPKKEAS